MASVAFLVESLQTYSRTTWIARCLFAVSDQSTSEHYTFHNSDVCIPQKRERGEGEREMSRVPMLVPVSQSFTVTSSVCHRVSVRHKVQMRRRAILWPASSCQ